MSNIREPVTHRVEQNDGSYKSFKMSVGKKKIQANGEGGLTRMFYCDFIINGVHYCHRHIMLKCHLCREDRIYLKQETDEERDFLGLRSGGDPELNERSERWSKLVDDENMKKTLQRDILIQKYGRNHAETHPQYWRQLMTEWKATEREINDKFLAETDDIIQKRGTSQCCYWACKTPAGKDNKPLRRCAGCKFVKYCCEEHQALDWKWEHNGECTSTLPEWFRRELEQDRERNLRGDYAEYKT